MDLLPQPDVHHLAFIGLMGAGKTTIGERVAARLHWSFVDVDRLIEEQSGCSIIDLWQACGESAFRPLEREILLKALAGTDHSVVAAPCDIVVDHDASHAVGSGDVVAVYLRAHPERLAERIAADDHLHSFLDERAEDALRASFSARDSCYERLADHVVEVDDLDVEGATEAVLEVMIGTVLRAG